MTPGQPTDTDRAKAMDTLKMTGHAYADLPPFAQWDVDAVAAALAEERERARAPFLALAEEYASRAERVIHNGSWHRTLWIFANRIRRAAKENR